MMPKVENIQEKSRHGGPRKGAGRKNGSASKKTREVADRAAAEGITPLEVMLKTMTMLMDEAQNLKDNPPADNDNGPTPIKLMLAASNVAKDAAPYIHPRLANVSVESTGEMSFTITTGVPKNGE